MPLMFEGNFHNMVFHFFLGKSLDFVQLDVFHLNHLYRFLQRHHLLVFLVFQIDEFLAHFRKLLLKLAYRFLGLEINSVDVAKLPL